MSGAPTTSRCTTTVKGFPFAEVADWRARLEDLAARAEPERWDYVAVPQQHPLPVLDGYVRQTLARSTSSAGWRRCRIGRVSTRVC